MRRAAPLLLVLAAAGCASAVPAGIRPLENPATRAEAERAVSRGIGYLARTQHPDGSWGDFRVLGPVDLYMGTLASHYTYRVAVTALCCDGLLSTGRPEAAPLLARGARFLLGLAQRPVIRSSGDEFYSVWTHAYVLRFLSHWIPTLPQGPEREAAEAIAREQIRLLLILQTDRDGWAYYDFALGARHPTGGSTNSFTTATVLVSLYDAARAGIEVPEENVRAAARALRMQRIPTGAYTYGYGHRYHPQGVINRPEGSLGRTPGCDLALHLWEGDPDAATMAANMETMMRLHHFLEIGMGRPFPHEAYYAISGYFYYYGHAYAARVLERLAPGDRARYLGPLAAAVTRLQGPDGSWIDYPDYGYGEIYGTGFSLDVLGRLLRHPEW